MDLNTAEAIVKILEDDLGKAWSDAARQASAEARQRVGSRKLHQERQHSREWTEEARNAAIAARNKTDSRNHQNRLNEMANRLSSLTRG